MSYKVGAIIIKNNCMLLSLRSNILGSTYDFPMWDFKPGQIPIETINKSVKRLGIIEDNKYYIGKFNKKKTNIYLYGLNKWTGNINTRKYVWVHKSVLLMNKNSIPFSNETINELFN